LALKMTPVWHQKSGTPGTRRGDPIALFATAVDAARSTDHQKKFYKAERLEEREAGDRRARPLEGC
jgi:hypothetical protein